MCRFRYYRRLIQYLASIGEQSEQGSRTADHSLSMMHMISWISGTLVSNYGWKWQAVEEREGRR